MSDLSISSPPVKNDIMRIALAMADVLRLQKEDLQGLDAAGVIAWLKKNMPNLDGDARVTDDAKRQRNLCQKLSLVLGKSEQQKEACGALASHWCTLACSVKAALDDRISMLESMIAGCDDAECKTRMSDCKSRMDDVCSSVCSQKEIIESFARTADEQKGTPTKQEWATKMTAALSSVPTLAVMIDVVVDSCAEIEALCAGCTHKSASGGDCGCDEPVNLFTGGYIHGGSDTVGGLTIDSRVRKQTDERKKIMREFRVKAEDLFNRVLRAVYALGQRMGKGSIAMNDDLQRFVNMFSELENVYKPGIEYALTGFYVHSTAVEQRERFLGKLQALISTLLPLEAGANGDAFREIKNPLKELQQHCDQYSDKFRSSSSGLVQTRYGSPPVAGGEGDFKSRMESFKSGVSDVADGARSALSGASDALANAPEFIDKNAANIARTKQSIEHAADTIGRGDQDYYDDMTSGGDMTKVGLTLKNVVKSLKHFYDVSKMRDNLRKVAGESKSYNANYSEVLGKPFAALIDKERKNFEKFKEELESPHSQSFVYGGSKIPIAAAYNTLRKAVEFGSTGDDNISMEWNKEAISTMQLNGCNARIELYNVIQAIDIALMSFTDAITANPDEIKEISKILDSAEIVAEWFNEASGDHVAGLFEYMPWLMEAKVDGSKIDTKLSILGKGATSIIDDKGSRLKKFGSGHYFGEVKKAEVANTHPGNPFLMISPARAEYAREFARKTVERMLSLKNIIAAFAFMGARARSSGSGDSLPWEPARIYAALCKYLYVSAFAMGWDGYDAGASGDDKTNQQFAKIYQSAPERPDRFGLGITTPGGVNLFPHGVATPGSNINYTGIAIGVLPFDSTKTWSELITPGAASFGTTRFDEYKRGKDAKKKELRDTIADVERSLKIASGLADSALNDRIRTAQQSLNAIATAVNTQGATLDNVRSKLMSLKQTYLAAVEADVDDKIARFVLAPPVSRNATILPVLISAHSGSAPNLLILQGAVNSIYEDVTAQVAHAADVIPGVFLAANVGLVAPFMALADPQAHPVAPTQAEVQAEEAGIIQRIFDEEKRIWKDQAMRAAVDEFKLNIEDPTVGPPRAPVLVPALPGPQVPPPLGVTVPSPMLSRIIGTKKSAADWGTAATAAAGVPDALSFAQNMQIIEQWRGANSRNQNLVAQFDNAVLARDSAKIRELSNANVDTAVTAVANIIDNAEKYAQYSRRNVVGGAVTGSGTHNWIEYCDAIEQKGATRGWLIAFNPGDNAKNLTNVPPLTRCAFGCAMNSVPVLKTASGPFKTVGGWSGQFRETDDLFIRAIKAMVAKVMTVSGLFNMLNFASADDHTLSATRFTVGGGNEFESRGGIDTPANSLELSTIPQIHEDAVELYIRLPLLVEFYRDIFSLTGRKLDNDLSVSKDALIVALVPDMDLTWSSLMRLSFDNLGGSVITKSYAVQMINEINSIYDKYKGRAGTNLVSMVVNDFIADVNSRFGIMTRLESIKYKEMMQANRRAFSDTRDDDVLTDFDTLGDRDFADRKAGELPSDKFTKSTSGSSLGDTTEFKLGFIEALSKFRTHIDEKIRKATFDTPGGLFPQATRAKSDFHEQSMITKNDLKLATTPEQRFNTVYAIMSGIESVQKIDDNSHVMFHEMIVAPLAILHGVSLTMDKFVVDVDTQWNLVETKDRATGAFQDPSSVTETKLNEVFVNITRTLMSHVSGLSGMVDMNVLGSKVVVDHSKLQQFSEGLLEFVNRNIQKFRSTVNTDIIKTYEEKIQNLQSHLVEEVFRNESGDMGVAGLEKASKQITRLYGIFATNTDAYSDNERKVVIDPTIMHAVGPRVPGAADTRPRFISYCDAVRRLAYYDPDTISRSFLGVRCVLTRDGQLEKLFMKKVDGKDVFMYEDLMFASRWEIYESKHEFSTDPAKSANMGLMMRYNELLARYLEQFWDKSNKKIYTPMIAGIASNNDAAVYKTAGWPDLVMPLGHGNLPATIVSGANWARTLEGKFSGGGAVWGVTFEVKVAPNPNAAFAAAHTNFINALNTSSTAMAPMQMVNVLKHAFDQAAADNGPLTSDQLRDLEAYRNQIISAIGENWTKYGPIAAVAASVYGLQGGSLLHVGNAGALDALLIAAKYTPPAVIPAPMSELSGADLDKRVSVIGNPDEIMFASIAKVLQTMLTTQDKGVPLYVLPSLSDSSATAPRMKENIRANLPIFAKMFGMLAESCKILGNILSTGINVNDLGGARANTGAITGKSGVQGRVFAAGTVNGTTPFTGNAARQYLSRLLGKIASSSNAVVTAGIEVMKEVSDNPLFLETSENSIAAYRNITNVSPFMPLSSMLSGIRAHTTAAASSVLLPVHSPGSREFEFNYGTRFVLAQPKVSMLLDHAPGVREITENYNKMVQSDKHITLENVQRAMSEFVQISRWMTDLNAYAPILFSSQAVKTPLADGLSYQFAPGMTIDRVLDLTTNTDKKRSVAMLAQWVSNKGGSRDSVLDRERMQILNILDLGVNPVNMNALRREVPLVNMLNYSLTFDALAKDILGIRDSNPGSGQRNMFLALAIDPYMRKVSNQWADIFSCYSDSSASLGFGGHDRFAQDQIFRKALLYSRDTVIVDNARVRTAAARDGYTYPGSGTTPGMNRTAANTKSVAIGEEQRVYLDVLGRMRHDTTFIRNILFISMAHRMMRSRIGDEMGRITFPVVSGPPAVSMHITDENVWESYDDVRRAYE